MQFTISTTKVEFEGNGIVSKQDVLSGIIV